MGRKEREKITRKNEILDAAKKLFIKKGFFGTSMDEIALKAEFSKRTLYTYFKSKEEIYYTVLYFVIKKTSPSYEKAVRSEIPGIDKLRAWCVNYYLCYRKSPEYFSFVSELGNINFSKVSPQLIDLFNTQRNETRELLTKVFNIGVQDGSMKKDIDITLSIKYLFKVMPAIIAEYIIEKDLNDESFYQELDMILCGFKNR